MYSPYVYIPNRNINHIKFLIFCDDSCIANRNFTKSNSYAFLLYYKFTLALYIILYLIQGIKITFKVYEAISDSLENHKKMNCIVLTIILKNLCLFWIGSVYARKHQQIRKIGTENTLLYNLLFCFLLVCNN